MITYKNGNLLNSDAEVICHQVNCQGAMGSGVAKQIRIRWPNVYDKYKEYVNSIGNKNNILGHVQFVQVSEGKRVCNMFSQLNYGYAGERYTSYDAFYTCLEEMARVLPKNSTIAFPYGIGCCRGGANWEIISNMIETVLREYDVTFYYLEVE